MALSKKKISDGVSKHYFWNWDPFVDYGKLQKRYLKNFAAEKNPYEMEG